MPSFVLGRRWSPAPAGKFSPHAGAATHGNGISKLATHPPQHADAPSLQLAAVVLSPFPSHRRGHESAAAFSRSAQRRCASRQAIRRPAASAGNFSPHAGALTHGNGISALATHPPFHADVPFPQLAAAVLSPSRSHRAGMGGQRHSVDQPHVEARPAGLRSARLRPAELRMPQLRRPELQRQLSRGDGITSVFHGHTATPRPAAPHPLAALGAASHHPYYRPPRPGLSVSHHARRPLVPGGACFMLRGSSPHMPRQQWWGVMSFQRLPRKRVGKSEFFFRKSEFGTRN